MSDFLRLLLIEDSRQDADLVIRQLEHGGYQVQADTVQGARDLRAALDAAVYDVVIADYHLPQFDAPSALAIVREKAADIPFLVVSGTIGEERAVAMMKAGAQDYLMKGSLARLVPAVRRELGDARARRDLRRAAAERERLEEQFRQAQKMESIGRVAGAVAHDFNNLLSVIVGYAEMGLSDVPAGGEAHDAFVQIDEAAKRAADLAGRLLAFSRPTAVAPRVIVLNDLVCDFRKMLAGVLGENIQLEFQLDPDAGALFADASHLEQVLMNLVVNARDAMPEGGRVTVRTAAIPASRQIQLSVSDAGAGMSPQVLAHVFEPFFTTKPVGKGTGLGLATVYGIVKQLGGAIEVASEQGQGATFTMLFPAVTL